MRSKLAVGVYVHSFQNLDLLTQGWYALRCFVRRARDQESGLMDEVIEVPVPVESAAERVPADSSLDWIAIRAPPLTIKERRRREARQRYKMNRSSKAKGCLERAIELPSRRLLRRRGRAEPALSSAGSQWASRKDLLAQQHFNQFSWPEMRSRSDDVVGRGTGRSAASCPSSESDRCAAPPRTSPHVMRGSTSTVKTTPEDGRTRGSADWWPTSSKTSRRP